MSYDADDNEQDEIVALDTQTLELRYRFGRSLLNCAQQMAVGGEELFVCDQDADRLQVFSLAGEHRRSIAGEWKKPEKVCFAKDRLYLVEPVLGQEGVGRRIFVLSLQGDTLQVYAHPEGHHYLRLDLPFRREAVGVHVWARAGPGVGRGAANRSTAFPRQNIIFSAAVYAVYARSPLFMLRVLCYMKILGVRRLANRIWRARLMLFIQ